MKKLIALLSAAGLVGMMSGCGLFGPASPTSVTITIESISDVTLPSGNGVVKGTIEADSTLTNISMVIKNSSGTVVSTLTATFDNAYADMEKVDLAADLNTKIVPQAGATAASYTLEITAESGDITGTQSKTFTVSGGNTSDLMLDTATLGNTANSLAGTIDLDNGSTYTTENVSASNVGSIDLCYAYSTSGGGQDRLYVPKAARYGTSDNKTINSTAAGFNFTSTWPTSGYSETVRINPITGAQFDATTTKAAAQALWSTSNELVYAPVSAVGDAFLVRTSSGAYVLIRVLAYSAGTTGTVEFKYAK